MLNERQLKIVDLLEQQPRTPGELAQQTGVSGRTILRDIDYLNFTLNGKARISASGSAGYQLEIFERRSFFQLLQKHDNDDRLLALLLLNTFTPRAQLASALNLPEIHASSHLYPPHTSILRPVGVLCRLLCAILGPEERRRFHGPV